MRRRIEFAVTVFALILAIGLEGKAVGDVGKWEDQGTTGENGDIACL